ncbi:tripartite tricarboxylate transporter permease [Yanghanlia caeni]|uniref:Tripartite tricarboxylate transporter permease n=1 Tax=Yanghanlia caeni TaxID=3064283 RepID=A0ABU1D978_9BURK|nr:tripartite tricarboxylate transporter permease [Alcaligenaceae bacterium LG-2]NGR07963.1 tripartite tricarboxylate transporter permease [bacterium SGD-2]
METFSLLLEGFGVALQPINLMWAFIGSMLGTAIGILPGIGPALTIALLLPVTVSVGPVSAFIMFAGVLYGAMYGGSTTAILINTPGEAGSMMTALEGSKMARKGRGAAALATAAIGSFVAGTLATLALTFAAPMVAELAFIFTPADYFALTIMAFTSVAVVMGASRVRGFTSLFIGLALGVIGIDGMTGQPRMTFGFADLLDGVELTVVLVSVFAVGEILYVASRYRFQNEEIIPIKGKAFMNREDWRRSWKPWLRGAFIGFPMGAIPGGGSELPTMLSYSLEKNLSSKSEEFGHGAIEGVAGPEAANNAAAAGILVPLLTLGLPTSATAAILLVAFQNYGLQPGPFLFTSNAELVWGLIASLYVGNAMLLVLNLPLVGLWVRLLYIPKPQLYAGILVFAMIGIWGVSGSVFDLALMAALGVVSYVMRVYGFPIAPLLIGLILVPLAENQLRTALAAGQGHVSVLVQSPIAITFYVAAALFLFVPYVMKKMQDRLAP